MSRRFCKLVTAALSLSVLALVAEPATAMPRFAVRAGVRCSVCHVNPGGGSLRTDYGRVNVGQQQLVARWARPEGGWPTVDPVIYDTVRFGTDLRPTVLTTIGNPTTPPEARPRDTFTVFPMQADLYAAVHLGEWADAVVDVGLLGSYEAYGVVRLPFANSYLRGGRFYPTFGYKLPNHRTYTREGIGFGPRDKDVGVELGIEPEWGSLQLGVFNGLPGDNLLDDNIGKALVARGELRLRTDPLRLSGGASAYYNVAGDVVNEVDTQREDLRFGVHGGAAVGRFAYLTELDVARSVDRAARTAGLVYATYHELSMVVLSGLEVALLYEFLDPDITAADNGLHRLGSEVSLFPFPYGEIYLLYRISAGQVDNPSHGLQEVLLTLHLYI